MPFSTLYYTLTETTDSKFSCAKLSFLDFKLYTKFIYSLAQLFYFHFPILFYLVFCYNFIDFQFYLLIAFIYLQNSSIILILLLYLLKFGRSPITFFRFHIFNSVLFFLRSTFPMPVIVYLLSFRRYFLSFFYTHFLILS